MLLRARDELGMDMNEALLIGDSVTDIRAGLAAGLPSVLVLTGLGREQFREYSHVVDGLFHIATSLEQAAEMILQGSPYLRIRPPISMASDSVLFPAPERLVNQMVKPLFDM